jgi:FG-GAP repeat
MKNYLHLIAFLFFVKISMAQVAVNTTGSSADPSAILDISSTTKGLLVPRMTTGQRTAIPTPSNGLLVFDTNTNSIWMHAAGNWTNLASAAASNTSSGEESTGSGTWGDCSVNNITAYQPVGNEDGIAQDVFGSSVAISGDFAIVGSPNDDEGAGLIDNGSATILKRNASTGKWESQGKVVNPSGVTDDEFGRSVAISGDYAIVGTPYDDEGAGLVNNGSATIFKRNTGTGIWESQGKLVNPDAANNDVFGWSVAISGDFAIVGARQDDNATGSATIFKRNSGTGIWEAQGKLAITNPTPISYFGASVSIDGDYAIVGAPEDGPGSATIFKRNSGSGIWETQIKLTQPISLTFGSSVSISGNYAIVGDPYDSTVPGLSYNGSATIFKRNTLTGVWELQTKLQNTSPASSDFFGQSVSLSGDYAIVGSPNNDFGPGLINNGTAIIYKRSGNIWNFVQKFTKPNSNSEEYFGNSIGIDSNAGRFLVGAPYVQSQGMVFFGKVK